MIPSLFGKQEVGIWRVKKRFPRYGVPIWSLWPNIRFLPSIVAEKNVTKNVHIQKCMFNVYKNQLSRQTGSRNLIRFLPSTVTEKNATKNILDGRTDRRTEVKQYTPSPFGERGYNKADLYSLILFHMHIVHV
jgi:hypothetical protein